MLGLDRHAARVTWTVFLIVLVILLGLHGSAYDHFLVALFFAYMLAPAVESLARLTGELRHLPDQALTESQSIVSRVDVVEQNVVRSRHVRTRVQFRGEFDEIFVGVAVPVAASAVQPPI